MRDRKSTLGLTFALAVVIGCSGGGGKKDSGAGDTGQNDKTSGEQPGGEKPGDVGADAAAEPGGDASLDLAGDPADEAKTDAGAETVAEPGPEPTTEPAPEPPAEPGPEPMPDAAVETMPDTGADAGAEAEPETAPEVEADADVDAAADTAGEVMPVECMTDVDCDDGNACTTDVCSSGSCARTMAVAGTICRARVGICDVAETCSGASTECPPNQFLGTGTWCRAAAGPCDAVEYCTGVSGTCPVNGFLTGTTCRPSAANCDGPEICDGSGVTCPADAPPLVCGAPQACHGGACTAPSVLVLSAEDTGYADDVKTALLATGDFFDVGTFDATYQTPTLSELQAWDAVLIWLDYRPYDPTGLGDVLADYFDGGGRVVRTGPYANYNLPETELSGRFGDPGNGYLVIEQTPGGIACSTDDMTMINEPASPLLDGVTAVNTDCLQEDLAAAMGAVVVAARADGLPVVVRGTVMSRARVDLAVWPPDGAGAWTGDVYRLIANALLFVE